MTWLWLSMAEADTENTPNSQGVLSIGWFLQFMSLVFLLKMYHAPSNAEEIVNLKKLNCLGLDWPLLVM